MLLSVKAAAVTAALVAQGVTAGVALHRATAGDADHPGSFGTPIKVHGLCAGGPARYVVTVRGDAHKVTMELDLSHAGKRSHWGETVRSETESSNSGSSGVEEGNLVTDRHGRATVRGSVSLGDRETFEVHLGRLHGDERCHMRIKL